MQRVLIIYCFNCNPTPLPCVYCGRLRTCSKPSAAAQRQGDNAIVKKQKFGFLFALARPFRNLVRVHTEYNVTRCVAAGRTNVRVSMRLCPRFTRVLTACVFRCLLLVWYAAICRVAYPDQRHNVIVIVIVIAKKQESNPTT